MRGLSQMGRIGPTHEWGWQWSGVDGVAPNNAVSMGVAVTPVQNATNGGYAQLASAANVANDVFEIDVCINNIAGSTLARDCLATLAIDPAGGTAWADIYDLLCGQASLVGGVGGLGSWFRFPLFIKAGSSIGMRASVNSATLTSIGAFVKLRGKPAEPSLVRAGRYVEQFGINTAASTGVAMTAGTASEGSWTEIGTIARPLWAFEFGFGMNTGAVNNGAFAVDLSVGDATNKKIILLDHMLNVNSSENASKPQALVHARAAAGAKVYARTQAVFNNTHSIAVYGIGG